ncbi:MAG: VWA domain-containing protein [Solirubrobacteraceae bacterium]|nr:VWA domain-containing protein [Solirubrobacteraceae bacterium]
MTGQDPFVPFGEQAVAVQGGNQLAETSDYIDSTGTTIVIPDGAEPVAAATREEGIVEVADGSQSMTESLAETGEQIPGLPARTKAAAATVAASDVVARLQTSSKAANFSLGFVAFNDRVTVDRPIVPILDIPATDDFDPTAAGTGGTCMYLGLEAARKQIERWRQARPGTLHVSNVVVLYGDGLCSNPQRTLQAAAALKEIPNVTVAACLFRGPRDTDSGAQLLQAVASGPRFYKTVHDAEQLREFFLASITLAGGGI